MNCLTREFSQADDIFFQQYGEDIAGMVQENTHDAAEYKLAENTTKIKIERIRDQVFDLNITITGDHKNCFELKRKLTSIAKDNGATIGAGGISYFSNPELAEEFEKHLPLLMALLFGSIDVAQMEGCSQEQ